uniref:Uncharacterized protein n=1 Tax=Antarctic circular DNA molecule TaxID=2664238 RepID=A0A5Q2F2D8_9ZZZZ|nr:hypothetical protein [Antarctic circular DNA molecule]
MSGMPSAPLTLDPPPLLPPIRRVRKRSLSPHPYSGVAQPVRRRLALGASPSTTPQALASSLQFETETIPSPPSLSYQQRLARSSILSTSSTSPPPLERTTSRAISNLSRRRVSASSTASQASLEPTSPVPTETLPPTSSTVPRQNPEDPMILQSLGIQLCRGSQVRTMPSLRLLVLDRMSQSLEGNTLASTSDTNGTLTLSFVNDLNSDLSIFTFRSYPSEIGRLISYSLHHLPPYPTPDTSTGSGIPLEDQENQPSQLIL